MGLIPIDDRRCDGCDRSIDNAVKVHLGKSYCRACYQSDFKEAVCTACGGLMRHHRNAADDPICPACIRATRVCVRCERLTLRAGIRVGAGVACNSCAPYFRERFPCDSCGELSSRLSKTARTGDAKLCERCRRGIDQATCSSCSRHRPVTGTTIEGKPICASCLLGGSPSHICPTCDATVAGAGAGRCRPCLNVDSASAAAKLAAALVPDANIRRLWHDFAAGLVTTHRNDLKIKSRIEHAVGFFVALSIAFPGGAGLDLQSFHQRMDSRTMRRHLLASRFVAQRLGDADQAMKQEAIEVRRLSDVAADIPLSAGGQVLRAYASQLTTMGVVARTQRLYLRAAINFASAVRLGRTPWGAKQLLSFLRQSPGQAASLGCFVTYCRQANGWNVGMPTKSEFAMTSAGKAAKQVASLRQALAAASTTPIDQLTDKQLTAILSPALGLSGAALRRQATSAALLESAVRITPEASIAHDDALYPFARRWVILRQAQ